jgi:glutaryl-CoA dehydrogenase (non-decarboxylating)
VEEDERNHHWRREIFEKMAQLGFFGFCIEEQYGGNGMGFTEGALEIEEVAKIHISRPFLFHPSGNLAFQVEA